MTDESNPSGQPIINEEGQVESEEGSSSSGAKCCTECELTFSTLAKYKYHRLRLHGAWKAGFPCPDCHVSFSSISNLKRHRKKVHEEGPDPAPSGSVCPYLHCGHVAKDNYHLKVHMRKHTGRTGDLYLSSSDIILNAGLFQARGRSNVLRAHLDFIRSRI